MAILRIVSHWRDSGRAPQFFMIDARSAFPLLLFLVHIKEWTLIVALVATAFFAILARYGLTMSIFVRTMLSLLAGKVKQSKPWWRKKSLY